MANDFCSLSPSLSTYRKDCHKCCRVAIKVEKRVLEAVAEAAPMLEDDAVVAHQYGRQQRLIEEGTRALQEQE